MGNVQSRYRPDIDGLRAIAVLSVIFFHAHFPGFGGGFVGVDVFFVISGFLITSFLVKQYEKTGRISFIDFYAKRIRRLFPAIFLLVTVVTLFWFLFLMGVQEETNLLVKSIRYSVFGMANIFFQINTGGYFDGFSDEMPLLHFWSLGVEEQFYLIWPILVLMTLRRSVKTLVITLLSVCFLSFSLTQFLMLKGLHNWAFYSMPARAWELCVGALLVFLLPKLPNTSKLLGQILAILGISLIGIAVVLTDEKNFPGLSSLLPVLGAAFVIASGEFAHKTKIHSLLSTKFLVRIGVLSYGMYLWHWPMFAMFKVSSMGDIPPLFIRILAVAVSIMCAELSLKFVETPIRFGARFDDIPARKIILYGLCSALVVASIPLSLRFLEVLNARDNHDFLFMINERSPIYSSCGNNIGGPKCTEDYSQNNRTKNHLIVLGSSHAGTLFPMIEDYAKTNSFSTTVISHGGGPSGLLYEDDFFMDDEIKTKLMKLFGLNVVQTIKNLIQQGEKISVLIVPRWMQYSGQPTLCASEPVEFLDRAKTLEGTLAVVQHGLRKTLKDFASLGVRRVLIMLPYPEFKYNVLRCYKRLGAGCGTSRVNMEAYRSKMMRVIATTVKEFPDVRVFDPVDKLCTQEDCPEVIDLNGRTIPTVVDDDHPTAEMSRILGKKIKADLDWFAEAK
jgi:peptidoglycan/LPS O-acetylase OafA/YrhL